MEYEPQNDPIGADDTGASNMSRISELLAAIQSQLDELRTLVPENGAPSAEPDGDETTTAPNAGDDMSKELLMKAMKSA